MRESLIMVKLQETTKSRDKKGRILQSIQLTFLFKVESRQMRKVGSVTFVLKNTFLNNCPLSMKKMKRVRLNMRNIKSMKEVH